EQHPLSDQRVQVRRLRTTYDVRVVLVFQGKDDDVARSGGGGRVDLQGAGGIVVGRAGQAGGVAGSVVDGCAVEVERRDGEIGRGLARRHRVAEGQRSAA